MNYNASIKILSPVHIGGGAEKNWQRGADFVHHERRIFVLQQNKVWNNLDDREQSRYMTLMSLGKLNELERFLCDSLDLNDVASRSFEYDGSFKSSEIKTLLRDGNGEAYIPGSSIKGAMASAIYHFLYNAIKPNHYNDLTVKELLGTFDRALGRYIRPYDSSKIATIVSDIELYNLYREGMDWEGDYKDGSGFPMAVETFAPESEGTFRLSLAQELGDFMATQADKMNRALLPSYYKMLFGTSPQQNLFRVINAYTHTHALREKVYFEKYNDLEDIDLVIEKLEDIIALTETPSSDTCVLRMSFGSGFHGITGDWRSSNHSDTVYNPDKMNMIYSHKTKQKEASRYKTRRLAFPFAGNMGFVKIKV